MKRAATCIGIVECKLCGCYNSWSKKAVSFTITSVEAFLAEIPDTDYNLFLPQNESIKEKKNLPLIIFYDQLASCL